MLSAPKIPSAEVKAEKDEVEEEEVESLFMQRTEPIMNIQITQSTLITPKVGGGEERHELINPIFSETSTRSMATMNENAKRRKHTRTFAEPMSLKKRRMVKGYVPWLEANVW